MGTWCKVFNVCRGKRGGVTKIKQVQARGEERIRILVILRERNNWMPLALFPCCFILHFFRVALVSCCTFIILHLFYVALFPFCTFFVLYSFHVVPFFYFGLFSCTTFFLLHIFSCRILFMLHVFQFGVPLLTYFLCSCFLVSFFAAAFSHTALFSSLVALISCRFFLN